MALLARGGRGMAGNDGTRSIIEPQPMDEAAELDRAEPKFWASDVDHTPGAATVQ